MTCLLVPKALVAPGEVVVEGDELHYLVNVRRHKRGDRVEVRSADGASFIARVERIERNKALLIVEKIGVPAPSCRPVNLLVAVPKRNLLDDVIRKVSEIGAERIVPVYTERSAYIPEPKRVERWRRIAGESIRQCGRDKPLEIEEIVSLHEALQRFTGGSRFILHPCPQSPCLTSLLASGDPASRISVAIGPEGGFSDQEVEAAERLGFKPATFGSHIMRVETAAISAAVLCVSRFWAADGKSVSI